MARVLVTGGAGFIGSHVIERFLNAGYDVVALDNLSTGKRRNVPAGVELVVADVQSPEATALVAEGKFDIVAHLAAQVDVRKSVNDPVADMTTNVRGSVNLLEAVRSLPEKRRPRVVFASTGGALYGDAFEFPTAEDAPTNPDAPYGIAKLSVEYYMAYYGRLWGLETAVLRFGNVYGPRQDPHGEAGVIAIFVDRLARKLPLTVYGTGSQTRDYIFVEDVARMFLTAGTKRLPAAGPVVTRAFNVGTGVETSINELVETLAEVVGTTPKVDFAARRLGEIERSVLDPSKAERQFGWKAEVSLREGLERTYEWIRAPQAAEPAVGTR